MKIKFLYTLIALTTMFIACSDENEIDTEKPFIDMSFADAFPKNCDTLYFGETFQLRMLLSDNVELGSFNLDIHNNFDHHSHSTDVSSCVFDDKKAPINPFVFIDNQQLSEGLKEFETNLSIALPNSDDSGLYDEGDYHLFINVTDKEGWSAQKGLSIKILRRN